MKQQQLFFAILFFLCYQISKAQNNTSIYSLVGIGDLEQSYLDRSTGMANTGVALTSDNFLYQTNPASYAALNDHLFRFELAARFKSVIYNGQLSGNNGSISNDIQFKKAVLAMKIKPFWGVSVGLLPFSNGNYSFSQNKYIQGTSSAVTALYSGSGSLNQIYIANSFKFFKHLYVGVQASYLFGGFLHSESVPPNIADNNTLLSTINYAYSSPYAKLGLLYKAKISKSWTGAIGVTGSAPITLNNIKTITTIDGNTPTPIPSNVATQLSSYKLPAMVGGGISAVFKDKLTFAADYKYENWNSIHDNGLGYTLRDAKRYAAGAEYAFKKTYSNGVILERWFLQVGGFYQENNIIVYSTPINTIGGTIGVGVNTKRGLSLQMSFEQGQRGTTTNGLMLENYTQITLSVSYRELWYTNMKRYD